MVALLKKVIKVFVPYGMLVLYRRYIKNEMKIEGVVSSLNRSKYGEYNPAGGFGDKLLPYVNYIKKGTSLTVRNVFEIGANFAQDADFLMEVFGLQPKDVYVFEAHPEIYAAIKKIHSFNTYDYAAFNEEKEIIFNVLPINRANTGNSSILNNREGMKQVKVKSIRMDKFMDRNRIDKIDFLKIDVEGCSYEVLEGFGNRLKDISCIQLEAEHVFYNSVNHVFDEMYDMLKSNGFELVDLRRNPGAGYSDSFFVQKACIKIWQ